MKIKSLQIYSDGGARGNPGPAASAFLVIKGNKVIHECVKHLGKSTNNVAEYFAVVMALEWLVDNQKKLSVDNVDFFIDSELVVKQLSGLYKIKSPNLIPLYQKAKDFQKKILVNTNFNYVPRSKNKQADILVNNKLDEVKNNQEKN